MHYETEEERETREAREHLEFQEACARRHAFLDELIGPGGLVRQAPPPLEDFGAALSEHAAQIVKAARHVMGDVVNDSASLDTRSLAISALAKLVQLNIAIAKKVDPTPPAKTVRGVAASQDPQD